MLCQVPEDYHLKQFASTLTVSSALTLPDEVYINGLSKLFSESKLVSVADISSPPANWLNIALCDLQIHWEPSTTYRFRFNSDFYRDPEDQPNPQYDVTYTTNPLPAIPSANPAFGSSDVTNNTTIRLNFDRKMRRGNAGNIYLYEVASPSNILIGTYSNTSNITLALDGASISFSTLGKLKANTQYYILSDANIYRDYDNFYLPQITSTSFYTFTTDQSTDQFPDLITIQFVTGDVALEYIRYRGHQSNLQVDATIAVADQYRLRRPPTFIDASATISSGLTYNKGNLYPVMETSYFECYDTFLTYNKGTLYPVLETLNFNQVTDEQRFRNGKGNFNVNFDLPNYYIRNRRSTSTLSNNFDQSSTGDWGMLSTTRSADTYSTNTTTTINGGPRLIDSRNTNTNGIYSLAISPSDINAVSSFSLSNSITTNLVYSPINNQGITATAANNKYFAVCSGGTNSILIFDILTNALVTTITVSGVDLTRVYMTDQHLIASNDSGVNTCYVYNVGTWNLITTVSNPGESTNAFGRWLSANSTYFAVSAFWQTVSGQAYAGTVYVYNITTGALVYTLTRPSTQTWDLFGQGITMNEDYIFIHDKNSNGNQFNNNGRVNIFNLSDGSYSTSITNPVAGNSEYFGGEYGIDCNNNYLVISSRTRVYAYSMGTWTQQLNIALSGATAGKSARISDNNKLSYTNVSNAVLYDISTSSQIYSTSVSFQLDSHYEGKVVGFSGTGTAGITSVYLISYTQNTYNNTSKTLTMVGNRIGLYTAIDQITFVPATGYSSNFILTYTATRSSDGFQSIRFQNINRV